MARPKADKKRTEAPAFRMTKGEMALLGMKAVIEGVNMSELVRRAIWAYKPTPVNDEQCHECGKKMIYATRDENYPIDIDGKDRHILKVTEIPTMICECGEETQSLSLLCDMEDLIHQMVLDALRYRKELPNAMSLTELFQEEYLGKEKRTHTCSRVKSS